MAIFNFSAKLDEKLIDDVTVLDKIIKLVVVIGFSYLFSQTQLFYIYPILIFSVYFRVFTSWLTIIPLRIRILFSKSIGIIYSELFLFLFFIFTSDGRPDHHYQIALPVVAFLITSLLSSTFYQKFYSPVLTIIFFLIPLIIHNIYFAYELANVNLINAFSTGIYINLLIYPLIKLFGSIKHGDRSILQDLSQNYFQIIPFICLSIVAYNSSTYLLLIVICFRDVLYFHYYATYDGNSNYFSRVYHENVIIKNPLNGLFRVDIILFMSGAILVSFLNTNESIEKPSISNIIFIYALISISYTTLFVMFSSKIRNKYMVIGDVNIDFKHEKVANMNIMNMPTFRLYDKYFLESLEIKNRKNFDVLTRGTECIFVFDVYENDILENIKAKSGVLTYYLYEGNNVPFQVKNYANISNFETGRFSLTDFINERNIESALVLKSRIERFMDSEGLSWQDKHGLQDLLNMRIQLFNIGDIQLRVLACFNLIEMNIRYYYFLRSTTVDRAENFIDKVSMGLMVNELRRLFSSELSVSSFEVSEESYTLFKRGLIEIKYLEKFSRKNSILSLLNVAVFLRNKTMGHGSVMSISADLWILTEYIALTINNFFAPFFSSLYFYYEDENGSYVLNCNKHRRIRSIGGSSFFRQNSLSYRTDMYKVLEGFIYIYNGSVNGNREYINYINGKRIKPDVVSAQDI